ncbi:hypothetical protein RO3G_11601 [Rhizopus delemar RA 99-880]|uniref:Uncharacterized protein n=1 Tax=Rhizopus delemar (strain RA 99-880 / ATCC MYA-4621 / FGSC 9543 / NRRL 43880) TaxID=246409 RepID=I1CEL0_RHIO9|nr:hypothetical protein RO3G_11601 [Rhizopus delemar RA 99-880]|eukprot:EIE86890.1 hypothetical protein RO3G_11601 [Rhizopus delemar RA 99-880]
MTHSIFSQAENSITLGDGVEPTEIDLGTTNNPNVGETRLLIRIIILCILFPP